MEGKKVGFFQESPLVNSWTRLASAVLLGVFIVLNGFWFLDNETHVTESFMKFFDAALLVAIFAPKAIQKFAEVRFGIKGGKNA